MFSFLFVLVSFFHGRETARARGCGECKERERIKERVFFHSREEREKEEEEEEQQSRSFNFFSLHIFRKRLSLSLSLSHSRSPRSFSRSLARSSTRLPTPPCSHAPSPLSPTPLSNNGSGGTRPGPAAADRDDVVAVQRRHGRGHPRQGRRHGPARAGQALVRARGQVCVLQAGRPGRGEEKEKKRMVARAPDIDNEIFLKKAASISPPFLTSRASKYHPPSRGKGALKGALSSGV